MEAESLTVLPARPAMQSGPNSRLRGLHLAQLPQSISDATASTPDVETWPFEYLPSTPGHKRQAASGFVEEQSDSIRLRTYTRTPGHGCHASDELVSGSIRNPPHNLQSRWLYAGQMGLLGCFNPKDSVRPQTWQAPPQLPTFPPAT